MTEYDRRHNRPYQSKYCPKCKWIRGLEASRMKVLYIQHGKWDSSIGKDGKKGHRYEKVGYICPTCKGVEIIDTQEAPAI